MVTSAIIGGIIGALGTIATGFVIAGLWVWKHTTNLETEDHERIEELENDQRSQFAAELADLYTDIEEKVEEDDSVPDDMTHEEHVVNIVHREVNEDDVDRVIEELDEIGDTWDIYNEHVKHYNEAWELCAYGAGSSIVLLLVFVGANLSPGDAFSAGPIMIYSVVGLATLMFGKDSFDAFRKANRLKSEIDEQWVEYKRSN